MCDQSQVKCAVCIANLGSDNFNVSLTGVDHIYLFGIALRTYFVAAEINGRDRRGHIGHSQRIVVVRLFLLTLPLCLFGFLLGLPGLLVFLFLLLSGLPGRLIIFLLLLLFIGILSLLIEPALIFLLSLRITVDRITALTVCPGILIRFLVRHGLFGPDYHTYLHNVSNEYRHGQYEGQK